MTAPLPDELFPLIQQECSQETPAGLNPLVEAILARHGEAVQAILFYGSCLRAGQEKEGIVDLYVIVDTYRSAYGQAWFSLLNWLLPPNVFYLEVPDGEGKIRAKYAVLTLPIFSAVRHRRGFIPTFGPGLHNPYAWHMFSRKRPRNRSIPHSPDPWSPFSAGFSLRYPPRSVPGNCGAGGSPSVTGRN